MHFKCILILKFNGKFLYGCLMSNKLVMAIKLYLGTVLKGHVDYLVFLTIVIHTTVLYMYASLYFGE